MCLCCPWELNWCKRRWGERDTHTLHKHTIRLCAHPVLFETHLHCTSLHVCTLLSSFCLILCFSLCSSHSSCVSPSLCSSFCSYFSFLALCCCISFSSFCPLSTLLLCCVFSPPLSGRWAEMIGDEKRAAASGVNGFCLDHFNSWLLFWLKKQILFMKFLYIFCFLFFLSVFCGALVQRWLNDNSNN